MLRYIPPILSPELLKVLAEMGHGDKLVIGDANFAAASMAKNSILVRCDGLKATDLMDAILTLMPLDDFVDKPVLIMDKEPRLCSSLNVRFGMNLNKLWQNMIQEVKKPAG